MTWKMSNFVSFPLFAFTLVIKLKKIFLMKYEKMSDFISFSFFGLILVIKLRSFDLESH